ncbi:hypothetical protein [Streptomyces aureus]
MSNQKLLLLIVIAVITGYAAVVNPALGAAIGISAAVVGVVYLILKDDED